jgi:hypothetical protein
MASRNSSVNIVTRLRPDHRDSIPDRDFSLLSTFLGPLPVGTGDCFSGIKRPGHALGHSRQSSAKVKNVWSCTLNPPYFFMKHRDNFSLILPTVVTILNVCF